MFRNLPQISTVTSVRLMKLRGFFGISFSLIKSHKKSHIDYGVAKRAHTWNTDVRLDDGQKQCAESTTH
jgi:hypothetical protein